jgi:Ala-tRNA(Pro) deacylase
MAEHKLMTYLDEQGVKYVTIRHSPAYTAQEIAESAHVSGKDFAKTVMVKLDDTMAMAVLRGDDLLDVELLCAVAGAREGRLADEAEFQGLFPGVEVGAMPPLGNLWDLPVYADEALAADHAIAFNAGSHRTLVRLAWDDYRRLATPVVARIAMDSPPTG